MRLMVARTHVLLTPVLYYSHHRPSSPLKERGEGVSYNWDYRDGDYRGGRGSWPGLSEVV